MKLPNKCSFFLLAAGTGITSYIEELLLQITSFVGDLGIKIRSNART